MKRDLAFEQAYCSKPPRGLTASYMQVSIPTGGVGTGGGWGGWAPYLFETARFHAHGVGCLCFVASITCPVSFLKRALLCYEVHPRETSHATLHELSYVRRNTNFHICDETRTFICAAKATRAMRNVAHMKVIKAHTRETSHAGIPTKAQ